MKRALVIFLILPSLAKAHPWRLETGLPQPGASRLAITDEAPATPDGVEHPSLEWRGLQLGLYGDAFITYELDWRQSQFYNQFELSRLQVGGFAEWHHLAGVSFAFETVRSAGASSYVGIDGDSIVTRVKYAFAEVTPLGPWLALRGGMIPDPFLLQHEASWGFRVQGPTGLERDGFFTPSDLGASVEGALPLYLGSLSVAYENGEGYTQKEQNNGKNTTIALRLRPGRHRISGLLIHFLYRDGSLGVGQEANHRLAGGVSYTGQRLGAGAIGVWAMGWNGLGARDAGYLTAWVRGELPLRFSLFGRLDALWPDAHDAPSTQIRIIGGIAYALPSLVRVVISYEGTLGSGAVGKMVPAVEQSTLSFQLEARL